MKKILLTIAAVTTLATTTYATEDMFYIKGQVGWDKLKKIHHLKSKNSVFVGLGVGYYIMDKVRADLTFDHYIDPKYKGRIRKADNKLKSRADTLMVNGFVDLFDVSVAKIFAGAGIGMSMISGKTSWAAHTNRSGQLVAAGSSKSKKKNNFAYALHLGGAVEFAPGVNGELTYSYKDMGKFKKSKKRFSHGSLKGHHVAAGVRFDI